MRTSMPWLTALALALLCGTAIARDPAWLSLGAGNQVLARTVVQTQCPQISVDGTVFTMTARVASDGQAHTPPAHHRLVCETDVSGARLDVRVQSGRGRFQRLHQRGDLSHAESEAAHLRRAGAGSGGQPGA
jgi:hypothetical protein